MTNTHPRIRPNLLIWGAGLILALALALPTQAGAAGAEASAKRVCGIPPGDGAYSYIKARNVSCRVARKVGNKAGRKFCGRTFQRCNAQPGEKHDKGRVKAKGWRCKMNVGYEFYRATCERGNKRFRMEAAA